jgi:hypothetical protein
MADGTQLPSAGPWIPRARTRWCAHRGPARIPQLVPRPTPCRTAFSSLRCQQLGHWIPMNTRARRRTPSRVRHHRRRFLTHTRSTSNARPNIMALLHSHCNGYHCTMTHRVDTNHRPGSPRQPCKCFDSSYCTCHVVAQGPMPNKSCQARSIKCLPARLQRAPANLCDAIISANAVQNLDLVYVG